jgi:glycosyltransferase involved in cell wall biosynthesis
MGCRWWRHMPAPDDAAALAQALRRLIESGRERETRAAGARAAAASLPTWRDSAALFAQVLNRVLDNES